MPPNPARSLSPRCLFRKMVSIYPRSPPELPTWPGTQLVNKGLSKPGLGGWVEGRGGGGVGHVMSHLARELTRLFCQHACIVLLAVILTFFHRSSLCE